MRILHRNESQVEQIAFSPDGMFFGSTFLSGPARVWLVAENWRSARYPIDRPPKLVEAFTRIAFSAEPHILAVGQSRRATDICSTKRVMILGRIALPPDLQQQRKNQPDSSKTRQEFPFYCELQIPHSMFAITKMVYLNRGKYFSVSYGQPDDVGGNVSLFDASKNYVLVRELAAGSFMCGLAALPNSKTLYYIEGLRRVRKCDLMKSDQLQSAAYSKPIRELAINKDGSLLAVAHDYAIDILNADTLQRLKSFSGHKGRVDSLAFLPDGRLLSGSWDKTVRLWDVDSGRELAVHDWDVGGIRSVAVSPDGLLAAAGGDSGAIVLWDLDE